MLFKEALSNVCIVHLRTSLFGGHIVDLGATRRHGAQQISYWFRMRLGKSVSVLNVSFRFQSLAQVILKLLTAGSQKGFTSVRSNFCLPHSFCLNRIIQS